MKNDIIGNDAFIDSLSPGDVSVRLERKVDEIAALLPGVFRRARTGMNSGPLDAILSVMARLQLDPEITLEALDVYFDPARAPFPFLILLAFWVDLEALIAPPFSRGLDWLDAVDPETWAATAFPTGLRQLRALIANAVPLLKLRGTTRGLRLFLQTATGILGFDVVESQEQPFHIRVICPTQASPYVTFLRRIVEVQKPAYMTYELVFETSCG